MNRLRYSATLLLVTAFAVFQLLAAAPLLHPGCNAWGPLVQALQSPVAPAVDVQEGAATSGSTDECLVCRVSGLSAILLPGLAVFASTAQMAAPPLPAGAPVRALFSENLRSRAPPSA
jgi:hypothetical protein